MSGLVTHNICLAGLTLCLLLFTHDPINSVADDLVGANGEQFTNLTSVTEAVYCQFSWDELASPTDVGLKLRQVSNLNMSDSPDLNYEDVVSSFEEVFQWGIPLTVDQVGLRKFGLHLNEIRFSGSLRAGGVSRRSSLRFVLDLAGIGYYVDDNRRIVVTTKPLAKLQWLSQLRKPQLQDLNALSVDVRRDTVFSAGFWRIDGEHWEQALVSALEDSDRDVQFDAAYALGEIGAQETATIDALCKLLQSDDRTLREVATYSMAKIGPRAIPKLVNLIYHKDRDFGRSAIISLGAMGSAGNDAVLPLIEAGVKISEDPTYRDREDYSSYCREIAAALAQVEQGDAAATLCKLLSSRNAVTRSFAVVTITEIGRAEGCEAELLKLLSDPSTQVRRDTAYAFTDSTVQDLIKKLNSK